MVSYAITGLLKKVGVSQLTKEQNLLPDQIVVQA
jgi:hypothetical protein